MDALLHPRTWTWTRTRSTRHTPAELLLLPLLPNLHDDDIAAAAAAAAADDDEVVAEEKQADVVVVANVLVEGKGVEVRVYVRRDDDQFAVAVVEVVVVVVVVDGGQRWRLRHLPCTIDVTGLGACPPPGVAVSFPPHFHCAGGVVVCS